MDMFVEKVINYSFKEPKLKNGDRVIDLLTNFVGNIVETKYKPIYGWFYVVKNDLNDVKEFEEQNLARKAILYRDPTINAISTKKVFIGDEIP